MKILKILIPLLIIAGLAGGGYYLYTNNYFTPKNEITEQDVPEEKNKEAIINDDEYAVALGNIVMDYEDAYIQLAVIFNTDPEKVSYETWHEWVEENLNKWEKIEKNAAIIITYLEKTDPAVLSKDYSLVKTARAQSIMPNTVEFGPESITIPGPNQLELSKPLIEENEEGEANEINLVDPKLNLNYQVLQTAEGAPKGQKIKTLMEKFGFKDARTAAYALQKAQNLQSREWINIAEARDFLSKGAETIKNGSFVTVAVLGVVVSGGQIFTATSTAAKIWAGVNTVFGGADLVLQTGEGVSTIIDNKEGQTYFQNGRENLKPINTVIGFINLKDGLNNAGNLITVEHYGESVSDYMDKVNKDNANATPEQKQLFMLNFGEGNTEATLGYDGNFQNPYENNPAKLMADLEKILPKDSTVKINDMYVTIGTEEDMMKLMGIAPEVQPETPAETTPAGPTPSGTFSGGFSFVEPIAGVTYNGVLNFTIGEGGNVTGNTTITLNESVTTHRVVTYVKGTGTAAITGSFNNKTLEIYMDGGYTATGTSTTEGYTMKNSDSGTIKFTGLMTEFNVFTGKAEMVSNAGSATSMDWIAQYQI